MAALKRLALLGVVGAVCALGAAWLPEEASPRDPVASVPKPPAVEAVATPKPEAAPVEEAAVRVQPCLGSPPCEAPRHVALQYATWGMSTEGPEEVVPYDWEEMTGPLSARALRQAPLPVLSVRLVLGEVGADRLVTNRYGLIEALAVLETVRNRRDPDRYNPQGLPGVPPPRGCGPASDLRSCMDARAYLGLRSRRARHPAAAVRPHVLARAVDVAVTAWSLQHHPDLQGLTGGGILMVHRCGGAAYGRSTRSCDGRTGQIGRTGLRVPDIPGAHPFTGPLVLRAPSRHQPERRAYEMRDTAYVDYAPWAPNEVPDWTPLLPEINRREGPAMSPEGPAVSPAGPAMSPEGPAVSPNGSAMSPNGSAVSPEGPAMSPRR